MTATDHSRADKLSFVLYLILFHGSWTAWVAFGYPRLRTAGEHTLLYASINLLVRALLWVLPVFAYLHYVNGVSAWSYLKLRTHWRRGLLAAILFSALNFALLVAQRGLPQFHSEAITWNSVLSTSLLIGFVEEIPYRGFILQKLNEWFSFTSAAIISSVLFVAIHLPGWFLLHLFNVRVAIFIFVFGLLMAILLRYSRSLWAPIVSHSLNDFFTAVVFRL
jgi:uncharacterized protein